MRSFFSSGSTVPGHSLGRGAGAGGVGEDVDFGEAGGLDRGEALGEFLARLAGEAHDDVGRHGHSRDGGADAVEQGRYPSAV